MTYIVNLDTTLIEQNVVPLALYSLQMISLKRRDVLSAA